MGNASTQDGGGVKKETAKKDGAGGKQKEKKASKEKPPIKIPGDDESDEEGGVSLAGPRRRDRMLLSRDNEETLPFELVGLEVALEIVCNTLERDRRDVGEEVRASLGGLRKKVDTSNLERVRRVKSKVTRLTGRVAKVREEIKRYLDDDSDMRDMYLTRKALMEANALSGGNENMGGSGDYSAFRMGRPSVNYGKNFVGFNRGGGSDFLHGSGGSFKMRRQSLSFGGGGDGFGDYPGSGNQDPAQDRTGDGKNPGVASGGNASGLPQTPQNVEREKGSRWGFPKFRHLRFTSNAPVTVWTDYGRVFRPITVTVDQAIVQYTSNTRPTNGLTLFFSTIAGRQRTRFAIPSKTRWRRKTTQTSKRVSRRVAPGAVAEVAVVAVVPVAAGRGSAHLGRPKKDPRMMRPFRVIKPSARVKRVSPVSTKGENPRTMP